MGNALLNDFLRLTRFLLPATDSMDRLTDYIKKSCREVFNVNHCAVFFMKEEWGELSGVRPGDDEPISFPKGAGIAGLVGEEADCYLIEKVTESPVYNETIDGVAGYTPQDILSGPMISSKGDVAGVIQLVDKKKGRFKTYDEDLLAIFGREVAEALVATRNNEQYRSFAKSLLENISQSIDAKYSVTVGHCQRVRDLALSVARKLGFSEVDLKEIEVAVYLHKVGRLAYNWDIAELGFEEEAGQNMIFTQALVQGIAFPGELSNAGQTAIHCTEHVDGTGQPDGLEGKMIPLGSRIIAVCDTYDRMCFRGKPDGGRYSDDEIFAYLKEHAGTLFDTQIVDIFVDEKVYEIEKRRHKRIEYTEKVDVTVLNTDGTDGDQFVCRLMDLSSGGLLFSCESELKLNALLSLKVWLATGVMKAVVRVARVVPSKAGNGFDIGVYFIWNSANK